MLINYNCTCTIKRKSAKVLEATAVAASLTATYQPSGDVCLQGTLTGAFVGTVTVTGLVNGISDSEILTFTGPSTKCTFKQFSSIASITTSGSGAGTIYIDQVSLDGSPVAVFRAIKSGHPAGFREKGRMNQQQKSAGQITTNAMEARIDFEDVWEPVETDLFLHEGTGETFEITGVERQPMGSFAPQFWKIQIDQRQGRGE